jgi:hypothetical protein
MSHDEPPSEQNNNDRTLERMISRESALTDYDSDEHDWSDYEGYYDNIDEASMAILYLIYKCRFFLSSTINSLDVKTFSLFFIHVKEVKQVSFIPKVWYVCTE